MSEIAYLSPDRITAARCEPEGPRYGRDAQGYGRKIPSRYMVQLDGVRRWLRVYTCCVSNAGTSYLATRAEPFLCVERAWDRIRELSEARERAGRWLGTPSTNLPLA